MTQYEEIMQLVNDGNDAGVSPSILDPFAAVRDILPMILIWSLVIALIFIVLWAVTIISRIRAERAMMNMQKDMKYVRELLEQKLLDAPSSSEEHLQSQPVSSPKPSM